MSVLLLFQAPTGSDAVATASLLTLTSSALTAGATGGATTTATLQAVTTVSSAATATATATATTATQTLTVTPLGATAVNEVIPPLMIGVPARRLRQSLDALAYADTQWLMVRALGAGATGDARAVPQMLATTTRVGPVVAWGENEDEELWLLGIDLAVELEAV